MKPLYKEFFSVAENGEMTVSAPESFNYAYDVVDRIASEDPDRRALVWVQDESCPLYEKTECHERVLTFSDLSRLSTQAANYFAQNGIGKGDRVLLLMKRHYTYWYVLLALHKLGAVALPATYMLNHDDLVYRMEKTAIRAVVCIGEQALCDKVAEAASECLGVRRLFCVGVDCVGYHRIDTEIAGCPTVMDRVPTQKEDPILLYFTSGTTGRPKIVMQDGTYPLGHLQTALLWHNVQDGGLHLSVADTGWAKASWGKIYGQWLCGSAIMAYDYDVFSAVRMLEVMKKYHVTTFCAPPTIYRFFVKNRLLGNGFADVSYATTAGEAINRTIVEEFKELTGLDIHAGYGQTESVLLVGDLIGEKTRPGAMGKPSPLYRPLIVGEDGKETEVGVPGEIVIRRREGVTLACETGICIPPSSASDSGSAAWDSDFYHTGDIAWRDEDGYFWFVGRMDDMIKSSGYRISPFEVESVLIRHPAVMECAVTGVPDEQRGFVVKATVVLREGYLPDRKMTNQLREFVKSKTADYKAPRIVSYVDRLPKTFSGKIRHVEIRERDYAAAQAASEKAAEQSSPQSEEAPKET